MSPQQAEHNPGPTARRRRTANQQPTEHSGESRVRGPLRALILEDNPDDAELLVHELEQFGYALDWLRVETEEEFVANLLKNWDVIFTDFSLPQFDALHAIRHVRRLKLDTPVIVVSGAIGEEQAVTAMHEGAADYINKSYGGRLGVAVQNALSRRRMQRNQQAALRDLARSEQQYRSLFEQNPDAVFALDPDGNFTAANASLLRLTGYSEEELGEISYQSIVAPQDFEAGVRYFLNGLEGAPQTYEIRGLHRRGTLFDARVTTLPIVVDGQIVGVYGIAKDITARKQREREQAAIVAIAEALRTGESRREMLEAVLNVLQDLFGDANVIYSRITPGSRDIFVEVGVGKGKLWEGKQIPAERSGTESLVRDGRPFIKQRGRAYAETRQPSDTVDWKQEPDFSLVGVPVRAQSEVLGAIWISRVDPFTEHDIELLSTVSSMTGTALQRTEYAEQLQQLLRQTQEQARQMQQIVDTVPEAVLVLDRDGRVVMANRTAGELLPLLGAAQVGDTLQGAGADLCRQAYDGPDALQRDWQDLELPVGAVLEYAIRSFAPASDALAPDAPHAAADEPPVTRPFCLLVMRDVTEERRRQDALLSQERLATVGQLAAGIAHDFNNILAVISLYSGSLLKNPDSPKRVQYLETIAQQTHYAASLIAQILDFSRRSHIELAQLNLSDFLLDTVRMFRRTLPENIEIRVQVGHEDLPVMADAVRMQQVLMNLALNARDAMPAGGVLEFGLREWHTDTDFGVPLDLDIPAGRWIVLTIRDSGMGIDPDHVPHIFEPFFTTKDPGKGTGLGLAQVYGIVKQHNGEIDVQTEPGMGTTFTIFLPSVQASAAPDTAVVPPNSAADAGTHTILLVEDNAEAMFAIYDILHDQLGYGVHCAMSGLEAVQVFEEYAQEIDLVLCDMVLPETDGITLYRELCAQWEQAQDGNSAEHPAPTPRMVLMSGYPLNAVGDDLLVQGKVSFIQKPFTPDELARKLNDVLQRA